MIRRSTAVLSPDLWPLFKLRIATERLRLAPVTDADLDELAALADRGIHDPDKTPPWASLWTDRRGREFDLAFAQYFWSQRARWSPTSWTLPFAVRWGRALVGVQQIEADDFPTLRTVSTSSWLGRDFQGIGLGTEMRGAVLAFAFEVLGAEIATSSAFHINPASVRVSEKLGYARNGVRRENVGGEPVEAVLFRLTHDQWARQRPVDARFTGIEECLDLLGVLTREGRQITAV
jgi:RimJ/RimL family protein N-acetyltransferase